MLNNSLNKFLEMDPIEFDQGKGGWRSLIGIKEEVDIANLILEYADLNRKKTIRIEEQHKVSLLAYFTSMQDSLLASQAPNITKRRLNASKKVMVKRMNAGMHM